MLSANTMKREAYDAKGAQLKAVRVSTPILKELGIYNRPERAIKNPSQQRDFLWQDMVR